MSNIKLLSMKYDPYADPIPTKDANLIFAKKRLESLLSMRSQFNIGDTLEAAKYWKKYFAQADTRWVTFYNNCSGNKDIRFVPEDVFCAFIHPYLNPPRQAYGIDDKSLYTMFFPEIRQPDTLFHIQNGRLYSLDYSHLSLPEALEICQMAGFIVVKPTFGTCGGDGIKICEKEETESAIQDAMKSKDRYIVQKCLIQHPFFAQLNPTSINTIRVISYVTNQDDIIVLSSVVRVGGKNMLIDNVSAGGCSIGISEEGKLKGVAYSYSGQQLSHLPSGANIPRDKTVPGYNLVLNTVMKMHNRFRWFRLIAWDFSITENKEPVFIEFNLNRPQIDFMQLNNGPLFGDLTDEVITEVTCNMVDVGHK